MGSYQSTPSVVITNSFFTFAITTFNEYFIYTNYILNVDSTNFTTYTTNDNGDGTTTITFTNVKITGVGSYTFLLQGYSGADPPTTMLEGTILSDPVCYLKGTKILCEIDGEEQYINIENLLPGMIIKTHLHGYKKLKILGWNKFKNSSNPHTSKICKLYKLSKEKNSDLIEDLYVSGQHSILVDNINQNEKNLMLTRWSKLLKIDNKHLLMAYASMDFEEITDDNEYELFQIVLENENNNKQQFGIWANGILSETMSYSTFINKKRLLNYHGEK